MREQSMLKLTWDRVDMKRRHVWVPGEMMKGGKPFGLPLSDSALEALEDARAYAPKGEHVFQYLDPTLASLTDMQMRMVARDLLTEHGKVGQRDLRRELKLRYGKVGRTERRQAICREETAAFAARSTVVRIDSRSHARAPKVAAGGVMRPIKTCYTDAFEKAVERAQITGKHVTWHTLRHTWASWHIQDGTSPMILKALGNWKTDAMMQNYAHLSNANLEEVVKRGRPLSRTAKKPRLTLVESGQKGPETPISGTKSATEI
jgi:integrase